MDLPYYLDGLVLGGGREGHAVVLGLEDALVDAVDFLFDARREGGAFGTPAKGMIFILRVQPGGSGNGDA